MGWNAMLSIPFPPTSRDCIVAWWPAFAYKQVDIMTDREGPWELSNGCGSCRAAYHTAPSEHSRLREDVCRANDCALGLLTWLRV